MLPFSLGQLHYLISLYNLLDNHLATSPSLVISDVLLAPKSSNYKFTPKQVAAFYFKPLLAEDGEPTGLHACKACGKTRKHMPKTGYTNLVSHVRSDHPRFEAEMEVASTAATGTLLPWVRQKASNRYAWLLWIIKGNLPFSFVEMETTRRYTNLPPVCKEILGRDMENVTKAVEKNIGAVLPDKFGAILDDWTHGTEYYMELYACFELNGVRHCPLLSLAPIINGPDDSLNAESHVAALDAFLPFFCGEIEVENFAETQVLGGQSKQLSRVERTALQPLLKAEKAAEEATGEAEPTKIGFADRILKRRKVEATPSAYELLAIIPPTSNIVERLFSVARIVLRYERNRLTPLSLEMILFLKMNEKSQTVYCWLDFVTECYLSFSFCESPTADKYTKMKRICTETLLKYAVLVTKEVENVISMFIPRKFVFEHDQHSEKVLLALAPIVDDGVEDQTAKCHVAFLVGILSSFQRDIISVVYLVGDNCSVNTRLTDLLQVPFIGCTSHRLNLAVNLFLDDYEPQLELIQQLLQLRGMNKANRLRATRWGSTYKMIYRYFELRDALEMNDDDISATMKLHEQGVTLLDASDIFDALVEKHPVVNKCLALDATIVKDPAFEEACVLVLADKFEELIEDQRLMLHPFENVPVAAAMPTRNGRPQGFSDQVLSA
ncbi:Hypothetical protein PHPALM_1266 [Phytophthora palmivora]|uniref:BED-type domain-containing protein n=1 Tax=Phytophthora palmivora TaxID=4796 RepID=A0A2P4YSR4_9STRA|nr:Hypothetical protein PHPALM_1266 [Phytophthora palmivora]